MIVDIAGWVLLGVLFSVHGVVVSRRKNWNTNWKYLTWVACVGGVAAILAAIAHAWISVVVTCVGVFGVAVGAEVFWNESRRDKKDRSDMIDRNDMGW